MLLSVSRATGAFLLLLFASVTAFGDCTVPIGSAGQLSFQSPNLMFCDGTDWISLSVSDTGVICSSASKTEVSGADLRYCNGTNWISMDSAVTDGPCASLGRTEYDSSNGRMEWCNGVNWKVMGNMDNILILDGVSGSTLNGVPITSCGGSDVCNSTNPYVLSTNVTYTSVTLQNGAVMTGDQWSSGTPAVGNGILQFSVNGDMSICSTCVIHMNSKGYRSGQDGGTGGKGTVGTNAGGAGHGGDGGNGSLAGGSAYGDLKNPTTIGAGGGYWPTVGSVDPIGRGGGAIKIDVTGTLTLSGQISAKGNAGVNQTGDGGGGAGGSINLTAATVTGSGATLDVSGGSNAGGVSGAGAGGRIALTYTTDTYTGGVNAITYNMFGGTAATTNYQAAAGTAYLFQQGVDTNGRLIVNNGSNSSTSVWFKTTPILSSMDFDSIVTPSNGVVEIPSGVTTNLPSDTLSAHLIDFGTVNFATNAPVIASGGKYVVSVPKTFASVTVQSGGTLSHWRNSSTQVHTLDITTTGNFDLQSGGTINVNERGYAMGQDGGTGGKGINGANAGGAGHGGNGGTGAATAGGAAYGDIKNPLTIGAGGGAWSTTAGAGGAGGGLVKLNVGGTFTLSGSVTANGGNGQSATGDGGGGAGGSINITAQTIAGSGGQLSTAGGGNSNVSGGAGAGGRIALRYTTDSYTGGLTALTIANQGGSASTHYYQAAGGTTYLFNQGVDTDGHLKVSNGSNSSTSQWTKTTPIASSMDFDSISTPSNGIVEVKTGVTVNLASDTLAAYVVDNGNVVFPTNNPTIANGGRYDLNVARTFASMTIQSGGILSHWRNASTQTNILDVTTTGNFTLNSGGQINVDGRGYAQSQDGGTGGKGLGGANAGGGGHGGAGGAGSGGAGGGTYGNAANPQTIGAGGGAWGPINGYGGWGGGLVKLNVGGTLTLNGTISANGNGGGSATGDGGGGAGGGINLTTVTLAGGSATVRANGGVGGTSSGGGGGGGRVLITYDIDSYTGTVASLTMQSNPGTGYNSGAAGSINTVDITP